MFSAWTKFTSGTSGTAALVTTSPAPLEGVSSLRLRDDGLAPGNAKVGMALTSGANVATGEIRSLVHPGADNTDLGLFCMMQGSISTTSQAYWVVPVFGSAEIAIRKCDIAGINGTNNNLANNASIGFTLTNNADYGLQLKWQQDADSGFMLLSASIGQASDFSDLVKVVEFTVVVSPFVAGVSAGVGLRGTTQGFARSAFFDKTRIRRG